MSVRAGIVVTGTEVLSGIIADRNGPWLAERLRERGVDLAHVMIVGDRREDLLSALRFLRDEGMDVVITSGGLGPTADDLTAEVVAGFAGVLEQRIMRLFGPPESEIARTLRDAAAGGVPLDRLEITTCLRRGEIEIATVFPPGAADDYAAFEAAVAERHGAALFARRGETIDELVAAALLGPPVRTVATAESCTGGLMAARLTDRAGSSAYALGGVTAYSNEAKVALTGVPEELISRHGAVSPEVARALAEGAVDRFGADVGIGITGIAGPGGGTPEKPVGTVCLCLALDDARLERTVQLPGGRAMVRERTTTVAMHLLLRLLDG